MLRSLNVICAGVAPLASEAVVVERFWPGVDEIIRNCAPLLPWRIHTYNEHAGQLLYLHITPLCKNVLRFNWAIICTFLHILANGSWLNGQPKPSKEPGAPSINNMQINGTSVEIGPFTTAGTYHIYCTVHQGMNLTVIVQ